MSLSFNDEFPLFESIKCENGVCKNLSFHEMRMKVSSKKLWGEEIETINWLRLFSKITRAGLLKCKVYYNQHNFFIEKEPYEKREIRELIIVEDNLINYDMKYSDRSCFNFHTNNLASYQDIIIEKNGLLCDSSYANIALWDGNDWVTPKTPLLKGTKRASYLIENWVIEKDIHLKNLGNYSKISLINAMLDLGDTVVDIEHVSLL
jgi:4-amino-4-deoxychorismate lyase